MKYTKKIALALSTIIILANWSNEQSVTGRAEHATNIHGKLITQDNSLYTVENISINGVYKQVKLYKAPQEVLNRDKAILEDKTLLQDPKKGIKKFIDLDTGVSAITVPHAKELWHFTTKNNRKKEYIEIVITNKNKEKESFLIENDRELQCREVKRDDPVEINVPFHTLNKLTVTKTQERKEPAKSNT